MIISTAGYGSVGASAVIDFLLGYSDMKVFPFEFQLLHQADGISDLKYFLTKNRERVACNAAIQRFKTLALQSVCGRRMRRIVGSEYDKIVNDYLNSIIQVEWCGRSDYDPQDITDLSSFAVGQFIQRASTYCLRKINRNWHAQKYRKRYFSIMSEEEFDKLTRKFISDLLAVAGMKMSQKVIFDMAFSATNPMQGSEFFEDVKIIVVDRDPRDNYIAARLDTYLNSFLPRDSAEEFTKFYGSTRKHTIWHENVLKIQYEDLIYHYQKTTQTIMEYVGERIRPLKEFEYFDPDISVKYTKLYEKYPQYAEEVKYIEKHLGEYLYDFPRYNPRSVMAIRD